MHDNPWSVEVIALVDPGLVVGIVRGNPAGLLWPLFTWASTEPYHVNSACTEFVMHMYTLNVPVMICVYYGQT